MPTVKKTTTKKTTTATTKTTTAKAATKKADEKKYVFAFFNCNDNKDASSMNVRYNNEVFADTAEGRKALMKKVETEAKEGRINMSDSKAVKNDILKGEPTDATAKIQYGDIERLVIAG